MIPAERLVARLDALPTIPEAVARLTSMLVEDRASAAEFEAIIRPDPALTANLLKAANSAFYRGYSEVTTVRDAITRMGLRRVFEVSTSAAFRRTLPPRIAGYELEAGAFWRHCLVCAVYSERLARELQLMIPDVAFTAGLLHDVGKIVIGTCLTDEAAPKEDDALATVSRERETLGVDHGDVGEEIALRWRLPAQVRDAARWHHEPELAHEGVDADAALLVHVANLMAHRWGPGVQSEELPTIREPQLYRLGVTLAQLERVARESEDEIEKMGEVTAEALR